MKFLDNILGIKNKPDNGLTMQTMDTAYVGVYRGILWERMATFLFFNRNASNEEIMEEAKRLTHDSCKSDCKHVQSAKQDASVEFRSDLFRTLNL
jgi:hypothetical protein